jgi:DNA-binding response OmpR family regulator
MTMTSTNTGHRQPRSAVLGQLPPIRRPDGSAIKVLLIDDERALTNLVTMALKYEGWEVDVAHDGREALTKFATTDPDILVLDIMLPDVDGLRILQRVRAAGTYTPVLFLTARDSVSDRVTGLTAGADDYLTKPFDLGELVARLHALLRRSSLSERSPDTMTVGHLTIDTARRLVFVEGERAELTKREFDLLAVLAENAGVVLTRQRLLELVWGYDFEVDTNVADVFISYLRRKLEREGHPRVIHTVRGIGYVLRDEP